MKKITILLLLVVGLQLGATECTKTPTPAQSTTQVLHAGNNRAIDNKQIIKAVSIGLATGVSGGIIYNALISVAKEPNPFVMVFYSTLMSYILHEVKNITLEAIISHPQECALAKATSSYSGMIFQQIAHYQKWRSL